MRRSRNQPEALQTTVTISHTYKNGAQLSIQLWNHTTSPGIRRAYQQNNIEDVHFH